MALQSCLLNSQKNKYIFVKKVKVSRESSVMSCTTNISSFIILFSWYSFWTQADFRSLSKISSRSLTHAKSTKQLENIVSFNFLDKNCIQIHLSKSYQDGIEKNNEKVRKNRKILKILIDSVLFCGQQENALRGHNQTESFVSQQIVNYSIDFACSLILYIKTNSNLTSIIFVV